MIYGHQVTTDVEHKRSEHNAALWKTGLEADKEAARKSKRRLNYIANILIVSYPAKPELEGSVMR